MGNYAVIELFRNDSGLNRIWSWPPEVDDTMHGDPSPTEALNGLHRAGWTLVTACAARRSDGEDGTHCTMFFHREGPPRESAE